MRGKDRIALRILGSVEDAAEIINDVLLKAWNSIPPAKPASLRSFLGMLGRQLAVNRLRSSRTQKRDAAEYLLCLDELRNVFPTTLPPFFRRLSISAAS